MSPKNVDDCAKSVMEDNPDLSESQAFAICQEMENKGELSANELAEFVLSNSIKPSCGAKILSEERELDEEDPCWEGYEQVGMKEQNGEMVPNCVPEEDVEAASLSAPHILGGSKQLADRIEREEVDGNTVRYNGIKALTEGVWTDQESRESIHYMPENLDVELGGDVNVMHDQSDVSESGEIVDYEHGEDARGKDAIFVDFELNTDTEAGAYADKALQTALESDGQEGFGGPSVEIPPEGQDIKPDGPRGHPYTAAGKIDGLGLVGQPAAKDTAFAYQTQERAVALGSGEDALMLQKRQLNMDAEELRETLESAGIDTSDMEDEEVMDMAESLHSDLMGELEGEEMGDYGEDEENEMQEGEEEEEEEEKEMMDDEARDVMQDMINEEMDDIWGELDEIEAMVEEMQDKMASESELSEAREELAEADAVDEIEKTLSEVTDTVEKIAEEPNNEDRTLAEGGDWEPEYDNTDVSHSPSW